MLAIFFSNMWLCTWSSPSVARDVGNRRASHVCDRFSESSEEEESATQSGDKSGQIFNVSDETIAHSERRRDLPEENVLEHYRASEAVTRRDMFSQLTYDSRTEPVLNVC